MASRFQACSLVASPVYPNAIVWSEENFIAVASGHLVTILNPASPLGPRGVITLPNVQPFPIGRINREDLLHSPGLLPTCFSRDKERPCVRSISWSPLGLAPNAGCLLAVCSVDGRVKIYRPPFCDFRAEWVEVWDVSDMLFDYFSKINLGESKSLMSAASNVAQNKKRKVNFVLKPHKKRVENNSLALISAEQYGCCSAKLSSLVVAWSPLLQSSSGSSVISANQSFSSFSLLAIGGKSGEISLWRVRAPDCYTNDHCGVQDPPQLVGLVQMHNSWVTAITWVLFDGVASKDKVLLITGSSDGSVKIWIGYYDELVRSSEDKHASFILLKEVATRDFTMVSVLAVDVPVRSSHKMLLAVGKGSGSFDVWICDISSKQTEKTSSYDAHDHVVTGLSWAFDGRCLYSCSQDNSLCCWILRGDVLCKASIPSNILESNSSADLPTASDSSFGVAVSSGNLVLAVVRSLDVDLLNKMYQARTQRALVEFFWIGGQEIDVSSKTCLEIDSGIYPGFSERDLFHWDSNILHALEQYEHPDTPLVIWDIITSLTAFKQSALKFVKDLLVKWMSILFGGSKLLSFTDEIFSRASGTLQNLTCRHLHLLNIICRHVILSEPKADSASIKEQNVQELCNEENLTLWIELLQRSERELRERLVGFTFSTAVHLIDCEDGNSSGVKYWRPIGIAQMEQWISSNLHQEHHRLKSLVSEVKKLNQRLKSVCEYVPSENCSFCSASVSFESPEDAVCEGENCSDGSAQRHKLERCAVSMRVCPSMPLWYCVSCRRHSLALAPESFFRLSRYPKDLKTSSKQAPLEISTKPLCPFCGILQQRLMPAFLLSSMPV